METDNKTSSNPPLTFRVSSALKNIIGQDLITDDYVAVFELVKNSIDAYATKIILHFEKDKIIIADNGKGMSTTDITNKWLVLAFSAKKEGEEDNEYSRNFRDRIKVRRDSFAGNKGVGRFSCDRLGAQLNLQSKIDKSPSMVSGIKVDWEKFEEDAHKEFVSIPVEDFVLPNFEFESFKSQPHGTVLTISKLRATWDREKLLKLKEYLAKLIDPFGTDNSLEITFDAPDELGQDEKEKNKKNDFLADLLPPSHFRKIVNGSVENFIFETLENKTTMITVTLSEDGEHIHSILTDRGDLVYEIIESNPYIFLKKSKGLARVSCKLFYLNKSAKDNFYRSMKQHATQYGNIFLFSNNFRVYPIGEPGNDAFKLDQRRAQGYARHLGTRDVLGRLDVIGPQKYFRESSSRDKGLLDTPEYSDVEKFFLEHCLKRLENYVVGVTWPDKQDKFTDTTDRIKSNEGRGRVIEVVSKLVKGKDINLIRYSEELITTVDERTDSFSQAIKGLRFIAEKTNNENLESQIKLAEQKWQDMLAEQKANEEEARKERAARQAAEEKAKEEQKAREKAEEALKAETKRSLFLESITSRDFDTILNLHHQIIIYSSNLHHLIQDQINEARLSRLSSANTVKLLADIAFCNEQIISTSKIATSAGFRLEAEEVEDDLAKFFDVYASRVCGLFQNRISINVIRNDITEFIKKFKPINISIIIDNLIQNARRAGSSDADITISVEDEKLIVKVEDNGSGIDKSKVDISRIFERGYTTSDDGSGLGLYHVKNVLDEMQASIEVNSSSLGGAAFVIKIPK